MRDENKLELELKTAKENAIKYSESLYKTCEQSIVALIGNHYGEVSNYYLQHRGYLPNIFESGFQATYILIGDGDSEQRIVILYNRVTKSLYAVNDIYSTDRYNKWKRAGAISFSFLSDLINLLENAILPTPTTPEA